MPKKQRDDIEYEFSDLRRNEDAIPGNVLEQLGLDDEDLVEDERHEDDTDTDANLELDDKDDLEVDDTDADLDEDGKYDPAKMSKAMRKRLVDVNRNANRRIAKAEARAGETISKLETRITELERSGKTDDLEEEYAGKIEGIEAAIEEAMEKGDSKEVTKLTRELSEVTTAKALKKHDLEQEIAADDADTDTDTHTIIPRAQEWLDQQDVWWDDEEYADVREFVRGVDLKLQKKGYRPDDDDYYEMLEQVVEKKHPGVLVLTPDDELGEVDLDDDDFDIPAKKKASRRKKRGGRRRSPVAEGDNAGVARAKKKARRDRGKTLTRARVANMKVFGMDPENPEHVEAYLEQL